MGDAGEYYEQLLHLLRGSTMAWMADEIDAEVAGGRVVEKEYQPSGRRAEAALGVEEFTEEERLAIAVRVIVERTRVARAAWVDATARLHELADAAPTFADDQESEAFVPFESGYTEALASLERALGEIVAECQLHGPDVERAFGSSPQGRGA